MKILIDFGKEFGRDEIGLEDMFNLITFDLENVWGSSVI
jgi:hypothetical protein